jgi:DTW domain-containing protein YfiP
MEPELEPKQELEQGRRLCQGCQRPPAVCICNSLPAKPLQLRCCRVLVLQHWREAAKKKVMGTGPLVRLCLDPDSVDVLVDEMGREAAPTRESGRTVATPSLDEDETAAIHPKLARVLGIAGAPTPMLQPFVMFPGRGAVPLEQAIGSSKAHPESVLVPDRARDSITRRCSGDSDITGRCSGDSEDGQRRVLIVLDGTWQQAKKLWRRHRLALASAQRVVIVGCGTSRFAAIRRREPALGCVSTLEALSMALGTMESSTVAETLLAAFDAMLLAQSRFVPAGLVAEDYHKQQVAVPVALAPGRATSSELTTARTSGRVRAYAMCLTRHCPLTGLTSLVPVGVEDATLGARAATGTLSQVRHNCYIHLDAT